MIKRLDKPVKYVNKHDLWAGQTSFYWLTSEYKHGSLQNTWLPPIYAMCSTLAHKLPRWTWVRQDKTKVMFIVLLVGLNWVGQNKMKELI